MSVVAALIACNDYCPVTNMYDINGEETKNIDKAISLVVRLPNGQWVATTDFDREYLFWPQ